MESNHNLNIENPFMNIINGVLTFISVVGGIISVNFADFLKHINILLTPLVQICSLLSFIIFLFLNYDKIVERVVKIQQKRKARKDARIRNIN